MRIASGGVQHETNTFSSIPTTLTDFLRDSQCGETMAGGETIVRRYAGTNCIHGGYLDAAKEQGIELLPLLTAKAQPSGIVQQEAFDTLLDWFLTRLEAVLPVDGVLLDLHGAMVTEKDEDAEAAFTAAVRERVGGEVPIIVTLDLHANISSRLADLSDVIIGFDTYPHVDMNDRGREAVRLLSQIIRGQVSPVQQYRQLPLLTMPPMQCTLREPMRSLLQRLHQMEAEDGVLTATISMGFPFADICDMGVSALVTTDGDLELANRKADQLASWIWDLREELQPKLTPIEEVIDFVNQRSADELTIFADGSDNPGGGGPCDGTVALQALLKAGFQGAAIGVIYDPETVQQAQQAGEGETIQVRLGGKTDHRHGNPVEAAAVVKCLSDGNFVYRGPMLQGVAESMGPTATLVMEGVRQDGAGTTIRPNPKMNGVEVVVCSQRRQCLDAEMLRVAGVEPREKRLIVLKSAVHFRADFGPLATHIFDADTPGIHRPDFSAFAYQHVRRPVFPLDPGPWRSPLTNGGAH